MGEENGAEPRSYQRVSTKSGQSGYMRIRLQSHNSGCDSAKQASGADFHS